MRDPSSVPGGAGWGACSNAEKSVTISDGEDSKFDEYIFPTCPLDTLATRLHFLSLEHTVEVSLIPHFK